MRYKIRKVQSQEKKWGRIALVIGVMIYFLCIAFSFGYMNYDFPEWMFEMH